MDQQLLLKAVLIVIGSGNEKVRVSLCLGGDIPCGLGCQLRNDLVFARHGITSLLYFDCDLYGLFLFTENRSEQQAGSGVGHLRNKLVEPANCVVDFFLIVCVVISRLIAANRKAILSESTDLAANISSVKHEQLFKLLAVDSYLFFILSFWCKEKALRYFSRGLRPCCVVMLREYKVDGVRAAAD